MEDAPKKEKEAKSSGGYADMGLKQYDSKGLTLEVHRNPEQNLLQMSQISLWIDDYDDIFSDFDPRPYSQRSVSDDFLREAKKASVDKASGANIEIRFLVPENKRSKSTEAIIKRRLKEHFGKHLNRLENEMSGLIRQGLFFTAISLALMFATTLIHFKYADKSLLTSFMLVLLEPAGWFLFWEGLDTVIFRSKPITPDLEFYRKMSQCEVLFISY